MAEYSFLSLINTLPTAYDGDRLARGHAAWAESIARQGDDELTSDSKALVDDPKGRALLDAVFGNSPYLTQILVRNPRFGLETLKIHPDDTAKQLFSQISCGPDRAGDLAAVMRHLRIGKQQVALLTALADIADIWPLERVTETLSRFASLALDQALIHLIERAAASGNLQVRDKENPLIDCGLSIIGMGKFGAEELNYSSDIDIIVLYDQDVVRYTGKKTLQDQFVRMTRDLVKIMQELTGEGYVFRTDLRLRPDPGAHPIALSMEVAEGYYESFGQNWERAAMIKARAVAGDIQAGAGFLERIRPFIWRKYLDFAAIEDIHSIKRQVQAHRGHGKTAVAGHNIKVGRGGIREIEFFAQTQQLIAGGRDPRLRIPTTCGAIQALVDTGRLETEIADVLVGSYRFLRRLEHRLQMVADEQTHTLPANRPGLDHIATFTGFDDPQAFDTAVLTTLERVQEIYGHLFEAAPDLGGSGSLAFTGADDDPNTLKTLADMGFTDAERVAAVVRKWHHGRYRATRSTKAREMLTELMPRLLEALSRTTSPMSAFVKFDEFLGNLPAGIQVFSLFYAHPGLLDLVAEIMGTAPQLADMLSRNSTLLDGVLSADFFDPPPPAEELAHTLALMLTGVREFEDHLDTIRRWAADRKFQIGVQVLRNIISSETAGPGLSDIADTCMADLLPVVWQQFAEAHGAVASGEVTIIGMGKLGGREINAGSDLDLILVYDHAADASSSDGSRPLAPSQYFSRLSQRIINSLTALTSEGRLYEVDMRLRPSGSKGPLAVSFDAFSRYQSESAWTWEHMALTRARVVAGSDSLGRKIEAVISGVLSQPRDGDGLANDILDMRQRIDADRGTDDIWNIKYVRGGLLDLEFISQYLQLRHANADPSILHPNTSAAFERMVAAGILDPDLAEDLVAATILMRNMQGLTRLCQEGRFDDATAPEGLRAVLAAAGGESDFAALKSNLIATQNRVHGHFRKILGE